MMIGHVMSVLARNELRIEYEGEGAFRFISPPRFRAKSVGVTAADGAVVWWLVSAKYSETWIPKGVELLEPVDQEDVSEQFRRQDPPRQQTSEGARELTTIRYGEVPDGFVQMAPGVGPAMPPERDHTYEISAVGNHDEGKGIEPSFLPYVFERLRQAEGSNKRSGLGLGLAIARHIIELHHGEIVAESDGPGRGASFTVTLPAMQPIEPQNEPAHA